MKSQSRVLLRITTGCHSRCTGSTFSEVRRMIMTKILKKFTIVPDKNVLTKKTSTHARDHISSTLSMMAKLHPFSNHHLPQLFKIKE